MNRTGGGTDGKPRGVISEYLYLTWIVVRVVLTLVFWLALILGTFIGYLTLPIIAVTFFITVYAIFDATGLIARRSGRKKGR